MLVTRSTTSHPLSLRAALSWTVAGNALYAASQWGIVVALARLGSAEMVGRFALGLAIAAPVFLFTNLHLRAVQATDAANVHPFRDYLSLRVVCSAAGIVVILAIAFNGDYRPETSLVIVLIGVAKAFESISDVYYGQLQRHERMDRIAKSMVLRGWISLVAVATTVQVTTSVASGAVAWIAASAVCLFGYDIRHGTAVARGQPAVAHAQKPVSWANVARLARLALPLGLVGCLTSLNANIPRYFVERKLGEGALGILAAIAYFTIIGNVLINSLGQSASPRLAAYYASGDRAAFRNLLSKLAVSSVLVGGLATVLVLAAGREVLTLFYGAAYAHEDVFAWLTVAAAIGYLGSVLGFGMTAARHFRIQVPVFGLVLLLLALLSSWLIPSFGLAGAGIAQAIAAAVQLLLLFGAFRHALRAGESEQKGQN